MGSTGSEDFGVSDGYVAPARGGSVFAHAEVVVGLEFSFKRGVVYENRRLCRMFLCQVSGGCSRFRLEVVKRRPRFRQIFRSL